MAKAKLSPVFDEVRGAFGDLVLKEVKGKTVWAHKPKQSAEMNPAQTAFIRRCKGANEYANKVQKGPDTLALYQQVSEATGKAVYRLCTSDYHHKPQIIDPDLSEYEGRPGDAIKFVAMDDFGVVKALVTLSDADEGTLIEKGQAVYEVEDTAYWMYTVTKAVPAGVTVSIRIEAFDRPRGVGTLGVSKRL